MPKPTHTRVTISGVIGTAAAPVEHFSFNLNFPAAALAADATDAAADAKATAVRGALATTWPGQFGSDVIITEVRVAAVKADGHVNTRADGSYVQGINTTVVEGTQAKQPVPLQQALCVSLVTGRPGPTGKGRFFLPWPAISLDADDKRIPTVQVGYVMTTCTDFLQGIQTALGQQLQVVSSKGYMSEVTGLRIGRVPDTMRSRREDAAEGYITGPLA